MIFSKKLSAKQFIISQILILVISLGLFFGLYYILHIQYQKPNNGRFANGPITTLPKSLRLDLDQPADDLLTFQSSVIVSGQTTPKAQILITTLSRDLVIDSKTNGSFSTILDLDEGVNKITVAVFDPSGDSRSLQRTVYYSKEKI